METRSVAQQEISAATQRDFPSRMQQQPERSRPRNLEPAQLPQRKRSTAGKPHRRCKVQRSEFTVISPDLPRKPKAGTDHRKNPSADALTGQRASLPQHVTPAMNAQTHPPASWQPQQPGEIRKGKFPTADTQRRVRGGKLQKSRRAIRIQHLRGRIRTKPNADPASGKKGPLRRLRNAPTLREINAQCMTRRRPAIVVGQITEWIE